MKALSVAGAEARFKQSITFHSLLLFCLPPRLTLTFFPPPIGAAASGFTFQRGLFLGNHLLSSREPRT